MRKQTSLCLALSIKHTQDFIPYPAKHVASASCCSSENRKGPVLLDPARPALQKIHQDKLREVIGVGEVGFAVGHLRHLREANDERATLGVNTSATSVADGPSRQSEVIIGTTHTMQFEIGATAHEPARPTLTDDEATEQIINEKTREAIGQLFVE